MPIPGLTHLDATAIQVILAGKPVKIVANPLIGADVSACFGGGLSVKMAGDLGNKHVDWNLRLSTRQGNVRDYADETPV